MKTVIALLCLALTGCATTRLSVTTPAGVKVTASFPKNLEATKLVVKIGEYELKADSIKTDAAAVIREKNVGVSAVADAVSDAAKAATPYLK